MTLEGQVKKFRQDIPITRSGIFLNHAETAPMMTPVAAAMGSYLQEKFQALNTTAAIEKSCPKRLIGKLIGARETEICYTPNTSYGINVAANSLPFASGKNAVLWDLEFPGNVYPWLNQRLRGAEVHWLHGSEIDLSELRRSVDDQSVAVSVSHVNWVNGFRPDLKAISEIVHRKGGILFVDATQSAGAFQINVTKMGIDILACAFYKWLLGPSGAGFLYVREDLIDSLQPIFIGWNAVKHTGPPAYVFNPKEIVPQDYAKRFLPGSISPIPFLGAGRSLKMLLDVGIGRIEERVLYLTDHLIEHLRELGFGIASSQDREKRGGIVNFNVANATEVSLKLLKRRIWVSARSQQGTGGIRVSPHFYNTVCEISSFLSALRGVAKGMS
jgi:cysteine desulfurase/selenocysteine lyase